MHSLKIGRASISFAQWGNGNDVPTVIALHCSASAGAQWRTLAEALDGRYRLVAPDLYGYGTTDPWPGPTELALSDEVEIVLRLIARCSSPVHLVGHSYGAVVALESALVQMGRIASLTLIEPVAFYLLRGSQRDAALYHSMERVAERIRHAAAKNLLWDGMQSFVNFWSGEGAWEAMNQDVQLALSCRTPKVASDFAAVFAQQRRLKDYAEIKVPCLLLCGAKTRPITQRIIALLAETLPHVRHEVIDGAGHMAPLSHSIAVNALIEQHFDAVRSGRRHNQ